MAVDVLPAQIEEKPNVLTLAGSGFWKVTFPSNSWLTSGCLKQSSIPIFVSSHFVKSTAKRYPVWNGTNLRKEFSSSKNPPLSSKKRLPTYVYTTVYASAFQSSGWAWPDDAVPKLEQSLNLEERGRWAGWGELSLGRDAEAVLRSPMIL